MKAAAASVEGGSSARELKRWAKEKVNLGGEREKDTYIARDIVYSYIRTYDARKRER